MSHGNFRRARILVLPVLLLLLAATPVSSDDATSTTPDAVGVVELYGMDLGAVSLPVPLSEAEMASISGGFRWWVTGACALGGAAAGILSLTGPLGGMVIGAGCTAAVNGILDHVPAGT